MGSGAHERLRRAVFLTVIGLLAIGCGDDRVIMDDFPAGVAVVHGEVTAPDGSPLAGVNVTVSGWRLGCPDEGGKGPVVDSEGESDAQGTYRLNLERFGLAEQELCLVVRAEPPPGSSLGVAADTGATVTLTDTESGRPPDSVRVDLTLSEGG